MARRLVRTVSVGTRLYKPGDEVPEEDAKQITNPRAWADDTEAPAAPVDLPNQAGTHSGARLARTVWIGTDRYGPNDPIPDSVAAQITNPIAWEGGKVPEGLTADDNADRSDDAAASRSGEPKADADASADDEPADAEDGQKPRRAGRRT